MDDKVSEGNKEHVIVQWRKGHPCYKVANNLAKLRIKLASI